MESTKLEHGTIAALSVQVTEVPGSTFFDFESDSRMTTESLGISVPITEKRSTLFGFSCCLHCSLIPIPPRNRVSVVLVARLILSPLLA